MIFQPGFTAHYLANQIDASSAMAYILLISRDEFKNRRYKTYDNSHDMGEALVSLFENWLDEEEERKTGKPVSPMDGCHEYTTDHLYTFLKETMCEVICLVRQEGSPSEPLYIPYTIDWIAESCIFAYFKQQQQKYTQIASGVEATATADSEKSLRQHEQLFGANHMEVD